MKKLIAGPNVWVGLIALTLLSLQAKQTPARQQNPCLDTAQTQRAMNECATQDYRNAEAEMNRVFEALLGEYQRDAVVTDRLKAAQTAWLAYRDAQLKAYFPEADMRPYGSVMPMCRAIVLTKPTGERTRILKGMLNPEEGDACAFASRKS